MRYSRATVPALAPKAADGALPAEQAP
jgi:hypothetical protein